MIVLGQICTMRDKNITPAQTTDKSDKMRIARTLFMQGTKLQDIYTILKISDRTLNRWVEDGRWSELRAANMITNDELKSRVLQAMARLIDRAIEEDKFDRIGDDLSKVSKTLESLDRKNIVTDGMYVFKTFTTWLLGRAKHDTSVNNDFIQRLTDLQDEFLKERI